MEEDVKILSTKYLILIAGGKIIIHELYQFELLMLHYILKTLHLVISFWEQLTTGLLAVGLFGAEAHFPIILF